MITPEDVDARKTLEYKTFVDFIYENLFGDKGYIGKNLFQRLFIVSGQRDCPIRILS